MTIDLHPAVYYRAKSDEWTTKWTDNDFAARNLVQAVKGKDFKGYTDVKINGKNYRIENNVAGRRAAHSFASVRIANDMIANGITNAAIIPIPSSSHCNPADMFVGRLLAEFIQPKIPTLQVRAELFFNAPMPKSAQGGGRNPQAILANLRAQNLDGIQAAVLLDDVYTSGAHVKAATRFLRAAGITVEHAFVVGRTVWEQPPDMFKPASETICFI
ncbi:hypothetical protein [Sphingopyxis terrae]|uniref:hypothetical protein n=1 Tax=Sphingopyxis terrae TaxID=33052 RepID=UPI002A117168|nr:hypothetical protein [Sphingopyxis terrae]MDX8357752.1 hypothetical protein [Sphingopyxis terrae]